MRKTLRSSGPHHWLPLICLAVLVASAVLAPVRADAYWFETYLRTVKLIDAGEYICGVIGRPTLSRAARAIRAKAA